MEHSQAGPLEVLRRSVELLTCGPGQPTLPTSDLSEVGAVRVSAAQVVELLRHAPREVSDALWHRLFALAREGEATWTMVAAGAMLPRMVVACSRYACVPSHHIPGVSDVGARLWSTVANTASRYGYRHVRDTHRCVEYNPNAHATDQTQGRRPVTVLAEAVARGGLSPVEADLIARTRLEHSTLTQVAEDLGLAYITARRRLWTRHRRAELHQRATITPARPDTDPFASVMLRSSATPKDDRHRRPLATAHVEGWLRSSVAPEGDRHFLQRRLVHLLRGVAILGRPKGRPPSGPLVQSGEAQRVAILGRLGRDRHQWSVPQSSRYFSLRSSATPKGDRHKEVPCDICLEGVAILGHPKG